MPRWEQAGPKRTARHCHMRMEWPRTNSGDAAPTAESPGFPDSIPGRSPLHHALSCGKHNLVRLLLDDSSSEINAFRCHNTHKSTGAYRGAQSGSRNYEIAACGRMAQSCYDELVSFLLLDERVDVNLRTDPPFTPIYNAINRVLEKTAQLLSACERVDVSHRVGSDIGTLGHSYTSLLWPAAPRESVAIVRRSITSERINVVRFKETRDFTAGEVKLILGFAVDRSQQERGAEKRRSELGGVGPGPISEKALKSRSSVKATLVTTTVLQQSVEKSLALKLENSKLQHHISVLSQRLHEVIAELKAWSKITAAFCLFCGDNRNQVDLMEKEVAVVAEKKIVVRLPVAVAKSVVRAEVAEDVAMVEVVGKGKEVAVVAEEAEEGVGSQEENLTLVKRKVRESGVDKKRKVLEEERDAVRKRMNFWRPVKVAVPNAPLSPRGMKGWSGSDSGYGSPGPSGLSKRVEVSERVERFGEGMVPKLPVGVPMEPRSYVGIVVGSKKRLRFKGFRELGSVLEGRKIYGLDSGRGLVAYGSVRNWQGLRRNGYCGMRWYCWNQDGYLT
ncbi:hypothetical protein HOY80DRAFT_1139339 [Tuber brumale]|nr:hypothetical protein HOY80DRAFT_1139339 [Tuber brumale]